MWQMTRFVRWTALVVAAGLLTAGCTGSGSGDGSGDGGSQDDGKGASALDWGACKSSGDAPAPGGGWQSATLKVPLDWSMADGPTIGLALIRAKVTGDD